MLAEKAVVACFLESEGEILLLKRSNKVKAYQGKWEGISGYIETTPDKQALVEIKEEADLEEKDIELVCKGIPLEAVDEKLGIKWVIHPYLFHLRDRNLIKIDWEHQEMKWINPEEMGDYETVPKLKETLERVCNLKNIHLEV